RRYRARLRLVPDRGTGGFVRGAARRRSRPGQCARCGACGCLGAGRQLGRGGLAGAQGSGKTVRILRGPAGAGARGDRRMLMDGRFGTYGGAYVPEILMPALEQLEAAFVEAQADEGFVAELNELLAKYAGRPTPLTRCRNLGSDTVRIYLKREDLLHGGAHKTNQVLGQALLARRMGKRRIIAETGAGQHGVATALAGALFGLETRIYMGAHD